MTFSFILFPSRTPFFTLGLFFSSFHRLFQFFSSFHRLVPSHPLPSVFLFSFSPHFLSFLRPFFPFKLFPPSSGPYVCLLFIVFFSFFLSLLSSCSVLCIFFLPLLLSLSPHFVPVSLPFRLFYPSFSLLFHALFLFTSPFLRLYHPFSSPSYFLLFYSPSSFPYHVSSFSLGVFGMGPADSFYFYCNSYVFFNIFVIL